MFCSPEIKRKAAKQHKCTWCAEPIFAGETYHHWVSVDDGEFFTNKMHPECIAAMNADFAIYNEYEYSPFDNDRPDRSAA